MLDRLLHRSVVFNIDGDRRQPCGTRRRRRNCEHRGHPERDRLALFTIAASGRKRSCGVATTWTVRRSRVSGTRRGEPGPWSVRSRSHPVSSTRARQGWEHATKESSHADGSPDHESDEPGLVAPMRARRLAPWTSLRRSAHSPLCRCSPSTRSKIAQRNSFLPSREPASRPPPTASSRARGRSAS